ncbi:MAG TPA: histidinol-phosphatase [Chthonomonadaceae bacterium]|nr:histidinol-phosphatase [Chthonomonadaceae bacterium]
MADTARPWMVSLHGGHSGEFCDHADGTLEEILEAAVAAGYRTFGVSEHVPRSQARFLYSEERQRGWDVAKITADFARYAAALPALVEAFADRLTVLRGFEAEVVPTAEYVSLMRGYREQMLPDGSPAFDYFVGSVHYVDEIQIDGRIEQYRQAVEACGGPESLAVRYYETVVEMVEALRPDVVGHLDLIKKNLRDAGFGPKALETPRVHAAVERALEAVRAQDALLDLNTAGWRKGLGEPYPGPELVQKAARMGIAFCFGDDSHRTTDVGQGVAEARDYLRRLHVSTIEYLTREGDAIVRRQVSLET